MPDCSSRFTRHDNMLQHVRAHSRKVSRSSWPQSKEGAISPVSQLPPTARAASTPPDTSNGPSPNRTHSSTHKPPRRRSQQAEYYQSHSPLSRPEYSGATGSHSSRKALFRTVTTPNADLSSPIRNYDSDSYFPSNASHMSDPYEAQTYQPVPLHPTLNTHAPSWFFEGPVTPTTEFPLSPSSDYPMSPSSEFFPDSTYSRDGFSSTSTSLSLNDGTNPPFPLQLPTFGRQQNMSPLPMDSNPSNIDSDVYPANNATDPSQHSWTSYPQKSFMDAFDVPMEVPTYPQTHAATFPNDSHPDSADGFAFTSTSSMNSGHPMQPTSFTISDDTHNSGFFNPELDNKTIPDGMSGNREGWESRGSGVTGGSSLQNWDVQQDWKYL